MTEQPVVGVSSNGKTSVSKTEDGGSTPPAPAKSSALIEESTEGTPQTLDKESVIIAEAVLAEMSFLSSL